VRSVLHTRNPQTFEIQKDYLLQILQHECVLPEDAKEIIATGHTPEVLTVTVSFENRA
jgi:hypothetical protein